MVGRRIPEEPEEPEESGIPHLPEDMPVTSPRISGIGASLSPVSRKDSRTKALLPEEETAMMAFAKQTFGGGGYTVKKYPQGNRLHRYIVRDAAGDIRMMLVYSHGGLLETHTLVGNTADRVSVQRYSLRGEPAGDPVIYTIGDPKNPGFVSWNEVVRRNKTLGDEGPSRG